VLIMTDEIVGHMSEKVVIPRPTGSSPNGGPNPRAARTAFCSAPGKNGVAPMPAAGEGYNVHVTGLTHDEKGYPVMTVEAQQEMMDAHLCRKNRRQPTDIIMTEGHPWKMPRYVLVSYGISVRTSMAAMQEARARGIQGRLPAADHRLALSRRADSRAGRTGQGFCDRGDQPGADAPGGDARAAAKRPATWWGMPAAPSFPRSGDRHFQGG
jgi:hypothetical protein